MPALQSVAVLRLCSLLICFALVSIGRLSGGEGLPHIVLIMADDLGWSDLGCQGNGKISTPHIDALAAGGVRFTDAYAASPVCSPTRAALMTGMAPARLGITQHGADGPPSWPEGRTIQPPAARDVLPLERVTLAERLKSVGYATGFFGKWHLSGTRVRRDKPAESGAAFFPDRQGFDVNFGGCGYGGPPTYFDPYRIPTLKPRQSGEYLTDRLADEANQWMRQSVGQPLFVCLWTYNPHYPFEAPAELVKKYQGQEGPGLRRAEYGAQVEALDRAVGSVLEEINRLGIADRTLVIFTSDNGGWDGATDNRPLRSGKGDLYEGGLRVPLIVRWPGITKAGTTEKRPVISMDLTATILDAARVPRKDLSLDGKSLQPLLAGDDQPSRALYFHYPHFAWHKSNRPGAAMREGDYKLIRRFDNGSTELYDLANDLGEKQNLANDRPDVAARLNRLLGEWLTECNAALPTRRE